MSKPSKTGKARLTVRIGGAEGASGVTKTFDLTANSMELGILPLGVDMREGYVPLDEPVTCRLAVTGDADMGKYQVAWHNFDPTWNTPGPPNSNAPTANGYRTM